MDKFIADQATSSDNIETSDYFPVQTLPEDVIEKQRYIKNGSAR